MGESLTIEQYQLASVSIGAVAGALALATVFFLSARSTVDDRRRPGVTLSAAICGLAAFHYVLAIMEWRGAWAFDGTVFQPTEHPFINSSRFADWVLTLPMLAVQILFIVDLSRSRSIRLGTKLVIASLAMLALGYPGEVSTERDTKLLFLAIASVPLLYVVFLLWFELTRSLDRQHWRAGGHVSMARLVLVGSWALYPIGYLFPVFVTEFDWDPGWGEALRQTFYGVADLISKPLFGLVILRAARAVSARAAEPEPVVDPGGLPVDPDPDGDAPTGLDRAGSRPMARSGIESPPPLPPADGSLQRSRSVPRPDRSDRTGRTGRPDRTGHPGDLGLGERLGDRFGDTGDRFDGEDRPWS